VFFEAMTMIAPLLKLLLKYCLAAMISGIHSEFSMFSKTGRLRDLVFISAGQSA